MEVFYSNHEIIVPFQFLYLLWIEVAQVFVAEKGNRFEYTDNDSVDEVGDA